MGARRSAVAMIGGAALVAGVLSGVPSPGAAEAAGRSVTFTAAGDYSSSSAARSVLDTVDRLSPDLHLALGDLSYGEAGEEEEWCDLVTDRVGSLPFELLAGNHESDGRNGSIDAFAECLPNRLPGLSGTYARQYYVDVPADDPLVRIVMISPGIDFGSGGWRYDEGTPRYDWTENAIDGARASDIPWVVVGMHNPCLSVGRYGCASGADIANLLLDKRVDLVLGGHEHIYQRSHQLAPSGDCPEIVPGRYSESCVADSDGSMAKGAGTVFATIGTGGTSLRDVYPDDSEARYYARWSGLNANPTFGPLAVTVTETRLSASFERAAGGTFTDDFEVSASGAAPTPLVDVDRVAGGDRFEVAVNVSRQAYPDGAPVAYVATGETYPDALSAGAAAANEGGPLLLTREHSLPAGVRSEIDRLNARRVVLVGGPASVSDGVLAELRSLVPETVRVGGVDRFATSRDVVRHAFGSTRPGSAYVATGTDFPDAMIASAAAGAQRAPVLLLNGDATTVNAEAVSLLDSLGVNHVTIAGGPRSVSDAIQAQLARSFAVERQAGADRFGTSQRVNDDAFTSADRVFLATGDDFPDALAGSAWAGRIRAPLYVLPGPCVPRAVLEDIDALDARRVTLLGGTAALPAVLADLPAC